jgi:hypothetical protein
MAINATSFLLGVGAAWLAPLIARVFRPVAVEATAAGLGLFEDARRVVAEQIEILEDIAAEARARREQMVTASNGHHDDETSDADTETETEPAATPVRRRNGARRRTS